MFAAPLLLAPLGTRHTQRRTMQPGAERFQTAQPRRLAGEDHERHLHRIVGIRVLQDATADASNHRAVALDDGFQGRLVAIGNEAPAEGTVAFPGIHLGFLPIYRRSRTGEYEKDEKTITNQGPQNRASNRRHGCPAGPFGSIQGTTPPLPNTTVVESATEGGGSYARGQTASRVG
jgi:hypothetical protein